MQRKCNSIRDNHKLYEYLIYKEKELRDNEIVLKSKQKNWKETFTDVFHDSEEQILFCAAKSQNEPKYGLKIFLKQFVEDPVFYFDSDGPTHFNNDGNTKLAKTPIKTPHINYYDENGINRARRDPFIEENEQNLQEDINLGMHFFCSLVNMNLLTKIPKIIVDQQLDLFAKESVDIHEGIDFPDEN